MKWKIIGIRIIVSVIILLFSYFILYYCFITSNESYTFHNGTLYLKISLKKNSDGSSSIISSDCSGKAEHKISEWKLNYPIFHFECADINADGSEDIIVGVIKPARFDSISRKRIFIFKLIDGFIRPLWLGSRVSKPLEYFKVVHSDSINMIRTIELEENGKYLVADYKWQVFGLTFVKYLMRNGNLEEARKLLTKANSGNEKN